ncbi:MAG: serine hydrolase [Candidatus Kapaibacterium sp.]
MKKLLAIATFFVVLNIASGAFAQGTDIFINRNIRPNVEEPSVQFPKGFLSGLHVLGSDTTLGTRILKAMQTSYNKTNNFGKHGISASVIIPGRTQWSGGVGLSDATTPIDTNMLFEIASNTKTFTTALIMQLRDEGKLSLNDSLKKWIPAYAFVDSNITIRQLLSHSSGLYDYLNDDPKQTMIYDAYQLNPEKHWAPDEILKQFMGKANFKPGTSYRYCNTGFLLLGMIAEKAGGDKVGKQMHARFFGPLQLSHTFFGGEDSITIPFVHNWVGGDTTMPSTDFYDVNKTGQLTCAFAAGNIATTVGELARWGHALYTGQVVSKASLAEMVTVKLWPDQEYGGLGTFRIPYYTRSFFGHTGHLLGYLSYNFTNLQDSVSFCVYQNFETHAGDPTINDYALDILNAIYAPNASVANPDVAPKVSVMSYPNPAHDQLTIAYSVDKPAATSLRISDETGRTLQNIFEAPTVAGIHRTRVDLSAYHAGTYFYSVQTSAGLTTGKFVVE